MAFHPQVGDQLSVALKAADNCALPSGINVGQGEKYQLEIVPPEQLLSMLEGRELMLRRRFEVIYQEMLDTRDGLARVDFTPPDAKAGGRRQIRADEPGDKASGDSDKQLGDLQETPDERAARLAKRAAEMRDLRVNRALDNTDRSASETLTVADSFDDIREEMVNNRIDTPAVETRLKDQIADPLRRISVEMFPQLKASLQQLRRELDDPQAGKAQPAEIAGPGRRHPGGNEARAGQDVRIRDVQRGGRTVAADHRQPGPAERRNPETPKGGVEARSCAIWRNKVARTGCFRCNRWWMRNFSTARWH